MMPAMKATSQTNTIFGILLSVGLFIGTILLRKLKASAFAGVFLFYSDHDVFRN